MTTSPLRLQATLWLGVIAVGWAAIFIRLADAPPLAIAAWRLTIGAAPLAAVALWRRRDELARLSAGDWLLLTGSGLALAAHFATWIASLSMTTVASSVALVTTQPIWVAMIAAVTLGERLSRGAAVAMLVAVAGGMVIAGADLAVTGRALLGDLLALAGAVFAALYFVAGRRVRPRLSLISYTSVVYTIAALALLATALLSGQQMSGYSPTTWLMLVLMAVVAQIFGHSALNWALRYLSAAFVSVAILGEPVVSTLLAIPILGEVPGPIRIAGGMLLLTGVVLFVLKSDGTQPPKDAETP